MSQGGKYFNTPILYTTHGFDSSASSFFHDCLCSCKEKVKIEHSYTSFIHTHTHIQIHAHLGEIFQLGSLRGQY